MTVGQGTHEMANTVTYHQALDVAPWNSPFRPHRIGPFPIVAVEVTREDVFVHTSAGTIRIPPQMAGYSWRPA